jgi:hypothetical protein
VSEALIAQALAVLPPAVLAGLLRRVPEAMEAVGEFRPQSAACRLVASVMDHPPAEGVRFADVRPLGEAIAALIEGWPPGPSASLEALAEASAEMRRLCAASACGLQVDQERLDAARTAYAAAWSGERLLG